MRLTGSGSGVIRRLNAARLDTVSQFSETLTEPERHAVAQALMALLTRPEVAACRPEAQR